MESQTLQNLYVSFKLKRKSKCNLMLKIFYISLHIFFCLDFGFLEHKSKKQIFWKSITIIQSIVLCCLGAYIYDDQYILLNRIWIYVYLTHYILCVACLALLSSAYTFKSLLIDLEIIDFRLKANGSYNLEFKILLIHFLYIGYRIVVCMAYILSYKIWLQPLPAAIFFLSLITVINFVLISLTFVFYAINCRLSMFVSVLKTTNSDLTSLHILYKTIVDKSELYKKAFDPLFIVSLLYNIPEIMAYIYFALKRFNNSNTISPISQVEYIFAAECLALTYAPALYAGMLSSRTEEIKLILHDKLLVECDETKIHDIKRFVRYVEARPCQFRVCKVIPLDANLIGMLLSFCVTYLIVIIQFTITK